MGHIILLLRVLSDGMMIAATIYARIPEPPRKHTSAHARRIKVGSRSNYSAMPAQTPHSMRLDSLRYNFLPFIVKSPFLLSYVVLRISSSYSSSMCGGIIGLVCGCQTDLAGTGYRGLNLKRSLLGAVVIYHIAGGGFVSLREYLAVQLDRTAV